MSGVNSNLAGALRGPVIMITIGVLFLMDRFVGLHFGSTWPLILIVLGVLALAGAGKKTYPAATGLPPNQPYPGQPYPNQPWNYQPGPQPNYYPPNAGPNQASNQPPNQASNYAPNVPPAGSVPPSPPPPGVRR